MKILVSMSNSDAITLDEYLEHEAQALGKEIIESLNLPKFDKFTSFKSVVKNPEQTLMKVLNNLGANLGYDVNDLKKSIEHHKDYDSLVSGNLRVAEVVNLIVKVAKRQHLEMRESKIEALVEKRNSLVKALKFPLINRNTKEESPQTKAQRSKLAEVEEQLRQLAYKI